MHVLSTTHTIYTFFTSPGGHSMLIRGQSKTGKTTLALEVAHRLGIGRVVSTDSIRQIMRIMLSPELAPEIHAVPVSVT